MYPQPLIVWFPELIPFLLWLGDPDHWQVGQAHCHGDQRHYRVNTRLEVLGSDGYDITRFDDLLILSVTVLWDVVHHDGAAIPPFDISRFQVESTAFTLFEGNGTNTLADVVYTYMLHGSTSLPSG